MDKIALVTGANRGIGLETAKQLSNKGYSVILGCRDRAAGQQASDLIFAATGKRCSVVQLDVSSDESTDNAKNLILKEFGRVDVLINNAAMFLDPSAKGAPDLGERSVLKAKIDTILASYQINTLGALRLMQAFVPGMKERNYGRVVNISSGDGQLSDMNGGKPAYRLSKVSLNALTRIFADELKGTNVLFNSACPGWVKTRMGGPTATFEVEDAVGTILWLATTDQLGPQGGFYRGFKPLAW